MIRTPPWTSQPWLGTPLAEAAPNSIGHGLRAAWLMNAIGAPPNVAASNFRGTMTGTTKPLPAGSPYGNVLRFNGSTSYISGVAPAGLLDFLVSTAVFTVSFRIRFATVSADALYAIWGGDLSTAAKNTSIWFENRVSQSSPKSIRMIVGRFTSGTAAVACTSAVNAITDTSWHHVAVTSDGLNGAIYVDGIPLALATQTGAGSPSGPLTNLPNIGATVTGTFPFNGDIEHVYVWDRVLDGDEIIGLCADPYQVFAPPFNPMMFGIGGPAGYTLPADFGSFSMAGQDAGLLIARRLTVDFGALSLAGQDAGLYLGRRVAADLGTYTLSGQAANLLSGHVVTASAGTFALAGQDAGLLFGHRLTADVGTYTLAGQSATLTKATAGSFSLTADVGTFALAGQAAGLRATRTMVASVGTYAIAGQAAGLYRSYPLVASAGTYSLAGQDVGLRAARALPADVGVFALTGRDVILTYVPVIGYTLTADAGTFSLVGRDVTLTYVPLFVILDAYPDPFGSATAPTIDPFSTAMAVAIDPFSAQSRLKGS